jgi:hypothetical protein
MAGIAGGSLDTGAPDVGFLFLQPALQLGRRSSRNVPEGSGEESTGSEIKRILLMAVSNLAIKRMNWTGWHIMKAGEGEVTVLALPP